ncbi:hypothetical protein DOY81_014364 [Sarcophaga bullata]|nr:hypothetical protein DOY81_014364 [Sarcophaga bullata]
MIRNLTSTEGCALEKNSENIRFEMKLKFYKLTFLSLCMWNYAQAGIKITNDDISEIIDSCDYDLIIN